MIISFRYKWLEDFWNYGINRKVPAELETRLSRKLDMLNSAKELKDISSPPSNKLHPLKGDRRGQWAISVSGAWRLCFEFIDGDVYNLELVQYH